MSHADRLPSLEERTKDNIGMLSPSQLARFWGVHINTVYRCVRKGALRAYRLPGGGLRIRLADAKKLGTPVD